MPEVPQSLASPVGSVPMGAPKRHDQVVSDILKKAGNDVEQVILRALESQRDDPDRAEERVLTHIRNITTTQAGSEA